MGRRKQDTAPAPISDRVKALVERAKAKQGVSPGARKPVATACRSSTPPPAVTPCESPAPMSTAESPPVTQVIKKLRTQDSDISTGALSEVPSLPSFSASSYKQQPHHSDSASTICVDMAKLKLGLRTK